MKLTLFDSTKNFSWLSQTKLAYVLEEWATRTKKNPFSHFKQENLFTLVILFKCYKHKEHAFVKKYQLQPKNVYLYCLLK
jgi:hypothetical protein